jgi:hypothetical protein
MNYISATYNFLCVHPSDINEHLPVLYKYAKQCSSVLESGIRGCTSSYALTYGLLCNTEAQNKYHVLNDINKCVVDGLLYGSNSSDITYQLLWKNNLDIDLSTDLENRTFDLLFIDTWHVYGQLKRELEKFHPIINKYIIMHDTEIDKIYGETIRCNLDALEQSARSGIPVHEINKGLSFAITEFLEQHPEWEMLEEYFNNNGLTVLHRL